MSLESQKPIDAIIGNAPKEIKNKVFAEVEQEMKTQAEWLEQFGAYERKKTDIERALIQFANLKTSEKLRRFDVKPRDVPENVVHIIKAKDWIKIAEECSDTVSAITRGFSIGLRDRKFSRIQFITLMLHESLHFKMYRALQADIVPEQRVHIEDYRCGFDLVSRATLRQYPEEKSARFFEWLDEAIIEELTTQIVEELLKHPPHWLEKDVRRIFQARHAFSQNSADNDIKVELLTLGEVRKSFLRREERVVIKESTYKKERKDFQKLIDGLYQRNKNHFRDRDEIFRLFVRGAAEGNLLPIGRLIENTFGNGSFRKLGEGRIEEVLSFYDVKK